MVIPSPEYDAWMAWMWLTTIKVWAAVMLIIGLGLLLERLSKWARVVLLAVVAVGITGAFAAAHAATLTPCVVCTLDVWPVFCWVWWC